MNIVEYFCGKCGEAFSSNVDCFNHEMRCNGTGQQPEIVMKPNKKPEWTFTNPEDRTVQPEESICKTCFGKNKADRECDPAIPPCPDCQKPEEVIHNRVVYQSDIDLESRITELEQQRDEALSIVKLACKAADYRKRHQHNLIYEEIEILKIMNERTADN